MVVHMVSFKYKADTTLVPVVSNRSALRDIDGILDFKVGEDVIRSARSFDTGLVILFRDRASLDGYASHPRHVPVAQLGRDLSETIVAVDFDA